MQFTRQGLEKAGFVGWVPALHASACSELDPGVYVVTYDVDGPITFLERSRGGKFKRQDPTVTRDALTANWVDGAEVVYIGQTGRPLAYRLKELADFGAGNPIGHWGGRLIWQLPNTYRLLVAWRKETRRIPVEVEKELLNQFRDAYGKPPFANDPHRLGR